jgi:hypothetical protein
MSWIRKHRPSPGAAFGFAALMIALGGVALAAIPDSNGTIHGCYQKNTGNLRVVDSSADCRSSENAIVISQGAGAKVGDLGQVTVHGTGSEVLFTAGPLTFTGHCELFPNTLSSQVFVSTTQDHSVGSLGDGQSLELNSSEPLGSVVFSGERTRPAGGSFEFSGYAPDGTSVNGVLYEGANVLGRTDTCTFGGHVIGG